MPYGDLVAQKVQRYATVEDLKKHKCTIEEMEEYEPSRRSALAKVRAVVRGNVIYAASLLAKVSTTRPQCAIAHK